MVISCRPWSPWSASVATHHGVVAFERITDATEEPLEVDEAKSHINFIGDNEHDGDIGRWIKTARHKLEKDTGVILMPSTWRVTVQTFPTTGLSLELPIWPVQSLDAFTYVDSDGASQDLIVSPSDFVVASADRPAQIGLLDGVNWPTSLRTFQPGSLTVTAGFATIDAIPADLIMALLKLVGDFAGFRESAMSIPGQIVQTAPMSYADLIAPWKIPVVA